MAMKMAPSYLFVNCAKIKARRNSIIVAMEQRIPGIPAPEIMEVIVAGIEDKAPPNAAILKNLTFRDS